MLVAKKNQQQQIFRHFDLTKLRNQVEFEQPEKKMHNLILEAFSVLSGFDLIIETKNTLFCVSRNFRQKSIKIFVHKTFK